MWTACPVVLDEPITVLGLELEDLGLTALVLVAAAYALPRRAFEDLLGHGRHVPHQPLLRLRGPRPRHDSGHHRLTRQVGDHLARKAGRPHPGLNDRDDPHRACHLTT